MNESLWLVTEEEAANFIIPDTGHQSVWIDTHDAWLGLVISNVTGWIEGRCNRLFKSRSHTDIIIGRQEDIFCLKHYPVSVITSFANSDGTQVFSSDDYSLEPDTGIVMLKCTLTKGKQYIITYTAGYTTIPDDLKHIALWLIAKMHTMREQKIWTTTSRSTQEGTITFDVRELPIEIKMTLERYRNR